LDIPSENSEIIMNDCLW